MSGGGCSIVADPPPIRGGAPTKADHNGKHGVQILVNGEAVNASVVSLAELLALLGYTGAKIATAVNGDFVPERKRDVTVLAAGDRVEIVAPRQGG